MLYSCYCAAIIIAVELLQSRNHGRHTHTHTHTRTHTHTHTHTHTSTPQDAALYVREGEDNDKFYKHPQGKWSKRAYQALHSTVYHVFNLCVCTLLLFLALMEHPLVAPIVVSEGEYCVCAHQHLYLQVFVM